LKLSEVNEASSIIQNAAHEDANIIFGAVQDESMGDEVKITVIATGFKHQEMPQRRERMLSEATLPTMRYDVPIQPRVVSSRPAASRFASEMEPEVGSGHDGNHSEAPTAMVEPAAQPELIPVPASVFDDDFFRPASARVEPPAEIDRRENGFPQGARESIHFSSAVRGQHEDIHGIAEDTPVGDGLIRGQVAGGSAVAATSHAESDELDIPAFLRRGN
jgi:cell division protein FtsZ